MDKMTKEDVLTLDKFALRGQVFDLRCDAINRDLAQFRAERAAHFAEMKVKYGLVDGDSLDTSTGEITRAPRPEPEAKAEAPAEPTPATEAPAEEQKA